MRDRVERGVMEMESENEKPKTKRKSEKMNRCAGNRRCGFSCKNVRESIFKYNVFLDVWNSIFFVSNLQYKDFRQ